MEVSPSFCDQKGVRMGRSSQCAGVTTQLATQHWVGKGLEKAYKSSSEDSDVKRLRSLSASVVWLSPVPRGADVSGCPDLPRSSSELSMPRRSAFCLLFSLRLLWPGMSFEILLSPLSSSVILEMILLVIDAESTEPVLGLASEGTIEPSVGRLDWDIFSRSAAAGELSLTSIMRRYEPP